MSTRKTLSEKLLKTSSRLHDLGEHHHSKIARRAANLLDERGEKIKELEGALVQVLDIVSGLFDPPTTPGDES